MLNYSRRDFERVNLTIDGRFVDWVVASAN